MNRIYKRIAALLMAAMLMLMSLSALAVPEAEVFARGSRIKAETTIDINADTFNGLMAMFGAMPDENGQDMQSIIIDNLLGAVKKLRVSTITDGEIVRISLGNDNGELFNAYTSMAGEESFVVTSLLPGLELSLPAAMAAPAFNPQDAMALFENLDAYAETLTDFLTDELLQSAEIEEGSYLVSGLNFDSKVTVALHSHQVAGMLEGLLKVFKEDTSLQEALDAAIASGAAAVEAMGESIPGSKDIIAELEEGIADIKSDDDIKLANLTMYVSELSDAFYLDVEMLEDEEPVILLTIAVAPYDTGADMRFSILTADTWAEGPPDWEATRQSVIGGESSDSVLFDITLSQWEDEAANREELRGNIGIYAMGFSVGVDISSASAMTGTYASEGVVSLSVFGTAPLLTLTSRGYETNEEITAPPRDGLKKIQVSEELSEEAMNEVQTALMSAFPDLLERLKTVLPEEGSMLIAIIESMTNPGLPDQN